MSSQASSPQPKPKGRSPVETIVVWGGIALLAVLAWLEWQSRSTYQEKYAKLEEINENAELTEKDISALLADKTPAVFDDLSNRKKPVGAKKLSVYSWFTVNPFSKRELYVYYGVKNERTADDVASVIWFSPTEYDQPEPKPVAADPTNKPENGPAVDFAKVMGGPKSAEDQKKVVEGYLKFAPPGFKPPGADNVVGGDKEDEEKKEAEGGDAEKKNDAEKKEDAATDVEEKKDE